MSYRLAWLLTLVGCVPDRPPPIAIPTDEIQRFIEAFDRASNEKDTARLAEFLDSTYVYFNSRGQVRSRQYVIDLVGHPSYRVEDMSRTEIDSRVYGTLAVVGTRWTATPYFEGTRYDDDQRCVLVLSKQSGSLRLVSEHCTEIAE